MGTPLVDVGYIVEDSISLAKEDGTILSLKGTGGVTVDELKNEPTLKLSMNLIGLEKAKQFWGIDDTQTTTTRVKSLVNYDKYSVKMASKVVGSDTLEAPECSISGTPVFTEKQGWTVALEITIKKGEAGYLFDFGVVPAPAP